MQNEAAFGLHRPAEIHRGVSQIGAIQRKIDLLEQVLQRDVDRFVDHQAKRTFVRVLAQIDHGSRERVSLQPGHGDQELIRQIDAVRGHVVIVFMPGCGRLRGMPADKPLVAALVWFRRDLRADDNAALYHALKSAREVWCGFVLDTDLLDPLPRRDRRVEFIVQALVDLDRQLAALGLQHGIRAGLIVRHGSALHELPALAQALKVQAVYANHDDDPVALERDARVRGSLADLGIAMHTSKDLTVFERSEVLTASGSAYSVFTPYKTAWFAKLEPFYLQAYPVKRHAHALAPLSEPFDRGMPSLDTLGFEVTNLRELRFPMGSQGGREFWNDFLHRIDDYTEQRNYPAIKGPSYLGAHLRFGTLSIRELARVAHARAKAGSDGAATWLSELVWRDFYQQILHHHPRVVTENFKPAYDRVKWEHGKQADAHFEAWRAGQTGYPLVDAAMAQLNQTGYMHNRLRMVAASFLTKHLGIDWRRGEAYFALHLNDYELGSNNGGWQWAASTGCDAQPYFRIFNPVAQSRKFDATGRFIRRYLPQLAKLPNALIHEPWTARPVDLVGSGVELGTTYPRPIVVHEEARERALARFSVVPGGPSK